MQRARGTVSVFTFKDGLLARAAHDLALRCDGCEVTLDGEAVSAMVPLRALTVVGPVDGGVARAELYDDRQRREIEDTMRDEILHLDRYPEARFEGRAVARAGDGDGFDVGGELALAGRRAPLRFAVMRDGERYRASFDIQPTRWGIAPYKALLGAIKLKDVVRIELDVGAR